MSTEHLVVATLIDAENPWPGLSSFDEAAQRFFSGRDAESAELLRLVGQAPLTVLFGKSGLGKTSLVQAGLFPRLRRQNILPVYVRLNVRDRSAPLIQQAAAALQAEIGKHGVDTAAPNAGESLWENLHGRHVEWWSAKNQPLTPVFVFDQFEEAFTLGAENADAIEQLRLDLADLIENRIPTDLAQSIEAGASAEHLDLRGQRYKVLLSFREDFLPEVEGWKGELPSLMRNRLRLQPMSADRALQVVSGNTPTGRTHELVTDETAREIVRFVAAVQTGDEKTGRSKSLRKAADPPWDKLEIEPALLSLVCEGLNEKRKARAQATIDAALLSETGNAIIGDFYQRCVADVPEKTRRFIEDALITEGGFRNSYPLQDALDQGQLTEPLLRQLVDRRLLRIDHQLGADRVELIHDRLTAVVREHRDQVREHLRSRRQRRLRWAMGSVFTVLVAVVALFFVLWQNAQKAEAAAKRAVAAASFREATVRVANDRPDEALALLARALRLDGQHTGARALAVNLILYGRWPLMVQHDAAVLAVAWSPDGTRVATVSADRTARVWDPRTGLAVSVLQHDASVTAVAWNHDSNRIVTGSANGTVRVWNTLTSEQVLPVIQTAGGDTLKRFAGREGDAQVNAVTWSLDGARLLTSSERNARAWDAATGAPLGMPIEHNPIQSFKAAWSPDGMRVVTASDNQIAQVRDALTGNPLSDALRHSDPIRVVAWSLDGKRIVTGTNQTAEVWDANTGRKSGAVVRAAGVESAAWSPDGVHVLTGFSDNTAQIWNSQTGRTVSPLLRHSSTVAHARARTGGGRTVVVEYVKTVEWSPDGTRIITGSDDGTARIWDVKTGEPMGFSLRHARAVTAATWSPDGTRVITGSYDGTARIWDARTGQALATPLPAAGWVRTVAWSPDGSRLLTASGTKTQVWDAQTGQAEKTLQYPGEVVAMTWSPATMRVMTVRRDGSVNPTYTAQIWDAKKDQAVALLIEGNVRSAAWSPDGARVAVITEKSKLSVGDFRREVVAKIWDAKTGQPLAAALPDLPVRAVAWNPDGSRVAIASDALRVFDARTGHVVEGPVLNDSYVDAVAWNYDGSRIVVLSGLTAQIRDAKTAEPLGSPLQHGQQVRSIAWSPDGTRVVTVCDDGAARIWDARTGHAVGAPIEGVDTVAWSPDGARIVTDGRRIWDVMVLSPSDAPLLADVAEAVGGWRVNVDEGLASYGTVKSRRFLTALDQRVRASSTPPGSLEAILRWFFTDPMERPISPLSAVTPNEYVRGMLTLRDAGAVERHFPGHPLLQVEADAHSAAGKAVKLFAVDPQTLLSSKASLEQAMNAYHQAAKSKGALETVQRGVGAKNWNKLCWEGALRGHAKAITFACDEAVSLEPTNGAYRDSRGVVRTLTGDLTGAIEDFKTVIEWISQLRLKSLDKEKLQALATQRQRWIEALQMGRNPLTPEELKTLEDQ